MKILATQLNTPINKPQADFAIRKQQSPMSDNSPAFGAKVLDNKGKTARFVNWLGKDFDSAMQRLISGVTALFTQPFFDLNNEHVDEDTRKVSCARTIAKILVGTATGVLIREVCIHGSKRFSQNKNIIEFENERLKEKGKKLKNIPEKFTKWQQILLPEKMKEAATAPQIKKWRGSVGTFAALGIMIFTNFLVDAPLTTYFTNKITPKLMKKETNKVSDEGGQ